MYFESNKIPLLILGITAILFSRILFLFFNDPEGPNLLVVMGTAVIIYFLSLAAYLFNLSGSMKLLLAIFIQLIMVTGLYFWLN